jgi:hypothetical protein
MATALARRHWPAVALAILIGLLLVLPALQGRVLADVPFSSTRNIAFSDDLFYFARIREVLDGHPLLGNPYLWEHKAKSPAPAFLGEWLLAQPIRWLGSGVVSAGVLYDFFLPAIAALLAYAGLFRLTRERGLSLLGVAVLFWGIFWYHFGRAVSPQLNVLPWLTMFLLLDTIMTSSGPPRRLLVGVAAFNFGLLFYLYFYHWTFYLTLCTLLALGLTWRRDYTPLSSIAAAAVGGLILALPHVWLMARAAALPEYAETLKRLGLIESRFPSGLAIVAPAILLLGLLAYALYRGALRPDRRLLLLAGGLIAALGLANQHLITARNLEFSTHYLLPAVFWFVFSAAYLVAGWEGSARRAVRGAAFALGLLLVVFGFWRMAAAWPDLPPPGGPPGDRYLPVLDWLDANMPPESVIYAPPALSDLIPIYTSANVYFNQHTHLYFLSDAEVLDRFIVSRYHEDVDLSLIRKELRTIAGPYYENVAGHTAQVNRLRRPLGLRPLEPRPQPDEFIAAVMSRARELHTEDFQAAIRRHRADYLLWDRRLNPERPYGEMPFLIPIHEIGDVRIYRIKPTPS